MPSSSEYEAPLVLPLFWDHAKMAGVDLWDFTRLEEAQNSSLSAFVLQIDPDDMSRGSWSARDFVPPDHNPREKWRIISPKKFRWIKKGPDWGKWSR